jgi:hypothetical protein
MAAYRANLAAQTTLRGRGRPWQDTGAELNGILWVLWVLGTGGAVTRTAQEIFAVADLPSPFSAVGAGAQTGAHLARPG